MRRVTQQEGEGWRALAQQHGFGSAEGRFVLGRFIVEDRDEHGLVLCDEHGLVLCVVTPIPAGLDGHPACSTGRQPMRSLCRDAGGN
jgi:hypothetical protein